MDQASMELQERINLELEAVGRIACTGTPICISRLQAQDKDWR